MDLILPEWRLAQPNKLTAVTYSTALKLGQSLAWYLVCVRCIHMNINHHWVRISHSPIADVFVIWAKDDTGVVKGFVLERDFKGISSKFVRLWATE
jgi:hypothetical protein